MAIIANYYVDPVTGLDTNDGLSTSAPFATFQKGADVATAGQIVACKTSGGASDEQPSLTIDLDTNTGTSTDGFIQFIGVNSSWDYDGTRYILDGSLVANLLTFSSKTRLAFVAIEFNNATGNPLAGTGGDNTYFINCAFRNNGSTVSFSPCGTAYVVMCGSFGNDGDGFSMPYSAGHILLSVAGYNTGDGIELISNSSYLNSAISCLSFNNGGEGIDSRYGENVVYQCTSNDNGASGINVDDYCCVFGNRTTNNARYGIETKLNATYGFIGFNYINGNTLGAIGAAQAEKILDNFGLDSNIYSGVDGYNAPNTPDYDFNLTADATMRDIAITLPS